MCPAAWFSETAASQNYRVKLIERIAKFRAKEVVEREKEKAAAPKKR